MKKKGREKNIQKGKKEFSYLLFTFSHINVEKYLWYFLFLIAGIVALLYTTTLKSEFILDDLPLILNNPHIRLSELTVDTLQKATATTRPIAMLSFAFNYYFHQYNVMGYHVVNVLIHIITGIFLYFFTRDTLLIPSSNFQPEIVPAVALCTSFIWLAHPIQTQSVSYIIQRMNSMASMFYILSFFCYIRMRINKGIMTRIWYLIGSCIAGLLALGTKEMTASLPFIIFLYEWYFFQDLRWSWAWRHVAGLAVIILFLALILYHNQHLLPLGIIKNGFTGTGFTPMQRVLTETVVVMLYISLLLFPHPSRLNLDYYFPVSQSIFDPPVTLLATGGILFLSLTVIFSAYRERFLSFCLLWFLGNLVIESSVIPLDLVFEHRLYLPSMLFIAGIVTMACRFIKNKNVSISLFCIIFLCFSTWTFQRNMVWRDPVALYIDTITKSPGNPRPKYNLACEYAKKGDSDKAVFWLQETVKHTKFFQWNLINNDPDLDTIRKSEKFIHFYRENVPENHQLKTIGYD